MTDISQQPSHADDSAHGHAGPRLYLAIAVVLAVLTLIEVQIPVWLAGDRPLLVVSLLVTAFVKAGFVVAFYMHLRYDSRVYTGIMALAIVLITYFLWLLTFGHLSF